MGRKRRAWFQGAKYHITSRGNRKSSLFYDDDDHTKYLSLLKETKATFSFTLHAFCLMTNHTHLQLETSDTSPSIIMSHLNTKYAKYFNKKYDYSGHVFEKRYGAELLDSLDYEFDVSKYIHQNPLKAGLVDELEDYPWSSYNAYVNGEASQLVYTKHLLSYFPSPAAKHYEEYVKTPLMDLFLLDDGKVMMIPRKAEENPCVQK
ncbi:REP element-mobilizing transposase RayT [Neobacillus niacini]|uniref:transposase n=1 Tax=Neobacillus niacini TaxID=86668 RepID=UPI0028621273|nr:transposase [Neobacillus niacini]MDR7078890.1 REP element-mobilizing transposase RayT [Neobacillus niacini]